MSLIENSAISKEVLAASYLSNINSALWFTFGQRQTNIPKLNHNAEFILER